MANQDTTSRPSRMGRRSKLTRAVQTTIIETIEAGNYFDTACAAAGIHRDTAYGWLERGRTERERLEQGITDEQRTEHGLPPAAEERRYVDFSDAVEIARARCEARIVKFIHKQIEGGWVKAKRKDPETGEIVTEHAGPDGKLGLEALSRMNAAKWGRRQTVEVSGPEGGPIGVDASAGARIAARLDAFMRQVREDPQVIEGQVVRRAIEAGRDGSVVFDADDAGEQPEGGGGGEPDGAGV